MIAQTENGGWLLFRDPVRLLCARTVSEVGFVLAEADEAVAQGFCLAGFVSYEAATGMDPALVTHPPGHVPPVWLGVFRTAEPYNLLPVSDGDAFHFSAWNSDTSELAYQRALERIKQYIYAGDTYQVNFTLRLKSHFEGDAFACFRQLVEAQRCKYAVFIETGDLHICAASPELFFARTGDRIISQPMKGTRERGLTVDADARMAEALRTSAKDRAENVMIVDMIRNDIGRMASPGSVRASRLFQIERYPTLFQMISTVTAMTTASFSQTLRALFPCASITGAPKVRTMQIIRELETSPRGVYTGMAGYWLASGTARFNVAIRTVVIDRESGNAEYGAGGGIVWDSKIQNEYRECFTKARVLTRPAKPFLIIESLRFEREKGFLLLDAHIKRAAGSAGYFDYPFHADSMRQKLESCVATCAGDAPLKVRWLLAADGSMAVEAGLSTVENTTDGFVGVAENACSIENVFLYHKTTCRDVYDRALARFPHCRDVILVNENGQVTESCFANVVIELDGKKNTPPVSCGLLNGTYRQHLVANGTLEERVITVAMLRQATRVWLINSVRQWMEISAAHLRFAPHDEPDPNSQE